MRVLVALAAFFGMWAAYVATGRLAYRRRGGWALAALWLVASAAYGYLSYRSHCSQPLTCDVGGTNPRFLTGNPWYFTHYVPVFTAIGLAAFGAASVVIRRHGRQDAVPALRRTLALGTGAAVAAWVLVTVAAFEIANAIP